MFVLISITKPPILTSARFVFDGWKKTAIGTDEKEHFGMMQHPELDCGLLARSGGDSVPTVLGICEVVGMLALRVGPNPPK